MNAARSRSSILLGTVAEVDLGSAPGPRVRVRDGDLLTDWLPVATSRCGADRIGCAPTVGEQVLIACPGGDLRCGIVFASLPQEAHQDPAPTAGVHSSIYRDGATIEYDANSHKLTAALPGGGAVTVNAPGGVTVNASGGVTIVAPAGVNITGPVAIAGTLSVTSLTTIGGGLNISGGDGAAVTGNLRLIGSASISGATAIGGAASIGGSAKIAGKLTSGGDAIAGGISAMHHTHTGVMSGGGNTGEPV